MLAQRPQHHHYGTTLAFVPPLLLQQPPKQQQQQHHDRKTELFRSKPQRLNDNTDGVVYVNDRVSSRKSGCFCCGWENDDVQITCHLDR